MDAREIIQRVDLLELVKAAGGRVIEKPDGTGSSNCPLHDGNSRRSFSIYRGRDGHQRWYCWSRCHCGGDAIEFVMRWKKLEFRQAVQELEHWIGTVPEVTKDLPAISAEPQAPPVVWQDRAQAFVNWAQDGLWGQDGDRGMRYLVDRGLEERTIGMFMLGWNASLWQDPPEKWGLTGHGVTIPKGIIIPGWREGLWYVKARQLGDSVRKYLAIRGGTNTLFGVDKVTHGGKPMLIVEGEFDAMVGWQECAEYVDVVAMPGAGQRLSMADMMLLSTRRRILACLDDDEAGKAGLQYLQSISSAVEPVATPGGCHDLNDALLAGVNLRMWARQLCER